MPTVHQPDNYERASPIRPRPIARDCGLLGPLGCRDIGRDLPAASPSPDRLGVVNRHQADVIAYLVEENRVLKDQMRGRRLSLNDGLHLDQAAVLFDPVSAAPTEASDPVRLDLLP